jgi:hypothetical protein
MNQRVIADPSQHGWVEADGKWVWDAASGGSSGGSIQDGDTEGQITTWSGNEWTPEGAVVVSGESLLVGTDNDNPTAPSQNVEGISTSSAFGVRSSVKGNTLTLNRMDDYGDVALFRKDGDGGGAISVGDGYLGIRGPSAAGNDALTIDAGGDATFPGNRVYIGSEANSQIQFMKDGSNYLDFRGKLIMRHRYAADGGPNVNIMEVGADGNSKFSGPVGATSFKTVNMDDGSNVLTIFGRTIYSEGGNGFHFSSGGTNTILPCRSGDGDTTDGVVSLGNNIKRFNNLFLTGSVLPGGYLYQNGGEVVLSVDVLLDAFKELRTATADESSVETLRDAMSNCLGGLIERLEGIKHDADAAREEMIEDVSMPEVGTMGIQ